MTFHKGAVTISTVSAVTIALFIIGGFAAAFSSHEMADNKVAERVAATEASISALHTDIADIKSSQAQELQMLINLNKRI